MVKRLLVLLAAVLWSASLSPGSGKAGDIAPALGFVCRVLSAPNVAVVASLTGLFPPDSRIRFLDDEGNVCATGIVRSSYPDLSYIALDNGSVDSLKKGFVAFSPSLEEQARVLCKYSLNLPMMTDRNGRPWHALPPNTIVINYVENAMKPVSFHHYAHDFGCRACHHRDLDTPCRQCHPTLEEMRRLAPGKVGFAECIREKCIGCHKGHEGKSSECAWCHK